MGSPLETKASLSCCNLLTATTHLQNTVILTTLIRCILITQKYKVPNENIRPYN